MATTVVILRTRITLVQFSILRSLTAVEHPNGARLLRTRSSPTFSAPVYSSRSGLEEKNSPRSPRQPVKTVFRVAFIVLTCLQPSPSAGGLPPRNKSSPSLRAPITPFPVPLHQTNTQPPPPAPTRPPEPQAPAPSWPSLPVKVKQSIAPPANVTASGTTVPFQPGNASTAPSNPIGTPAPQRPRALTPIGSECYYYASKPIVPDPPPQAPPCVFYYVNLTKETQRLTISFHGLQEVDMCFLEEGKANKCTIQLSLRTSAPLVIFKRSLGLFPLKKKNVFYVTLDGWHLVMTFLSLFPTTRSLKYHYELLFANAEGAIKDSTTTSY